MKFHLFFCNDEEIDILDKDSSLHSEDVNFDITSASRLQIRGENGDPKNDLINLIAPTERPSTSFDPPTSICHT